MRRWGRDGVTLGAASAAALAFLVTFVALPLAALFARGFQNRDGAFVGLDNFAAFLAGPGLWRSALNTLTIAGLTTAIVVPLAFIVAFTLTRVRVPGRAVFKVLAQIPWLAPSMLPAIALVHLFGNQGALNGWLMGHPIHGPIGIVLGEVFHTFPHAVLILTVALSTGDARLYEVAETLGAGPWRRFLTITLPGARHGLTGAAMAVFTLAATDFGVPKVIGGAYDVLATDLYAHVVGRRDFPMAAVVAMALLVPAMVALMVDRLGGTHAALLTAEATPYRPRRHPVGEVVLFVLCAAITGALAVVLATAAYASVVTYWPYDLSFTLSHYDFARVDDSGWSAYGVSLRLAVGTALVGTPIVFLTAWLVERGPGHPAIKAPTRWLAIAPLAVPGMALGLAYIFFFNHPANPLSGLYGTMAILILSTVIHFHAVGHVAAVTALRALDRAFEDVAAAMDVSSWMTLVRVTVPLCLAAVLDIAAYFLINAMTTVSAVVFLYAPDTKPAAVAVLNMDDSGEVASAAAMAMMIVLTAGALRLIHGGVSWSLTRRTRAWRDAPV